MIVVPVMMSRYPDLYLDELMIAYTRANSVLV